MNSILTEEFIVLFKKLPPEVQASARKAYRLWRVDPSYPSLHFKPVNRPKKVYSVRVARNWRALGLVDGNDVTWFWVGSHSDYDNLLLQSK